VNGRTNRNNGSHSSPLQQLVSIADRSVLREEAFRRMLSLERKRAQRSRKSFLLTLLEMEYQMASENSRQTLGKVLSVLDSTTRETDVTGWYKDECMVGVMFTEIAVQDRGSILATIMTRVSETLRDHLTPEQFSQLGISFHLFPEEWDEKILPTPVGSPLYSDVSGRDEARRLG
jgi:hypothetical protein